MLISPVDSIDYCTAQKIFCLSDRIIGLSVKTGWQNSSLERTLINTLTNTITEHGLILYMQCCCAGHATSSVPVHRYIIRHISFLDHLCFSECVHEIITN